MNVQDVAKLSPTERFLYWIKERHQIYKKKEAGKPKPWTDDEVLQRYFFTNPYRENDKVTKWVKTNVRDRYADCPNLWFMLCVARQINRPETLQMLMDRKLWPVKTWNGVRVGDALDQYRKDGHPVYTGAYMVRAESHKGHEWYYWTKQHYMARIVLGHVWDARGRFRSNCKTLEETCKWLQTFHGWGGFTAYEVVSDLRWTKWLEDAPDIMSWANPGPGARRGLHRLHERPFRSKPNSEFIQEMRGFLKVCHRRLPKSMPRFEMRDVEHSLCEWDKYERGRLGQGRLKRTYRGAN